MSAFGAKPDEAREVSRLEGLRARAAVRRERFLASGKESYGGAVDAWEGQAQERVNRRAQVKSQDTREARDKARIAVMLAMEEEEAAVEERERRAAQRAAWDSQLADKDTRAAMEREVDAQVGGAALPPSRARWAAPCVAVGARAGWGACIALTAAALPPFPAQSPPTLSPSASPDARGAHR